MKDQISIEKIDLLLSELEIERNKLTQANDQKMRKLIKQLDDAGVYPITTVMKKHKYDAMKMVESYGARWHIWNEPLSCPHCSSDLRDHDAGPPYKREIAVYRREQDRTIYFTCPDCNGKIDR